ncbi:DNA cytosine methyltransferase [Ruminococcus flavefaciens]|uniref:DNA (cytosine-5-)-methyltransferase n=1 Tax=Ruminococcus flavefaciens TaxID=1265 RepID=A0A315XUM5_RUMFL|nr:DNA cytosine methyltransferase [Ruminococcus flavefaciens]PWJ10431.1 DNA (cytosine-5)-methyltransferase 1 [Ruminococcus flavefaciens]SSA51887.1 DNA (cytosine-5)-methyltransferase 1 [Ruminococcus flavefaciens]
MGKYKVVDLFAGAGGLSLGFVKTGKYDIKVAFENNPNMQETYRRNHPKVDVRGDVCAADYNEIKSKYGNIDVVIGGPPCQGFSNANRQKNTAVSQNNMLVKQYVRAIVELQPKAFIMENVSMLKSDVHRFYLEKGDENLIKKYNIKVKTTPLKLLDEKFAFDGMLDIIEDRYAVVERIWDNELYSELNIIYKSAKSNNSSKAAEKFKKVLTNHKKKISKLSETFINENENIDDYIKGVSCNAFHAVLNYYNGSLALSSIKEAIEPAIMIQRMLSKTLEIFDNNLLVDEYRTENGLSAVIRSFAVFDYVKSVLESDENGYILKDNVLCAADYGAPQKRMRFVVMGIKKSISNKAVLPKPKFDEDEYKTVRDAIGDLEEVEPFITVTDDIGRTLNDTPNMSDLAKKLHDTDLVMNHIITATTETALKRFEAIGQGQNFHSLSDEMKSNTYTDPQRTQSTIYIRLQYDEPSGTVVNVRKSMWIHPTKNRAISVREAARLQTFPDSFVFCGTKDVQYQQVGNAVPPIMAYAIAKKLAKLLKQK